MTCELFDKICIEESEIRKINISEFSSYFEFYCNTLDALNRCKEISYQFVSTKSAANNYKLFSYLSVPKFISVSKAAMELSLTGHPVETFMLTRVLLEIHHVTQYLYFHPEFISKYNSGALKIDKIRNELYAEYESSAGGRLFGLLSDFSHSTSELMFITLEFQNGEIQHPVLCRKSELIDKALFGVANHSWGFYFLYRCFFSDIKMADDNILQADEYLFNFDRVKRIFQTKNEEKLAKICEHIKRLDNK